MPTASVFMTMENRLGADFFACRGMRPEMAKQLKTLEKENARLKKMVAEQALDMEILKEAAKGNW